MDIIIELKKELGRGFSKSDLEFLIGLPKNNLASVLLGNKPFSKKSELKVIRFLQSNKPDPLIFQRPKNKTIVSDVATPTLQVKNLITKINENNAPISTIPDPKDKGAYLKWLKNN